MPIIPAKIWKPSKSKEKEKERGEAGAYTNNDLSPVLHSTF